MKKLKKTLACSAFALAQLGVVAIPMSLITTQQTCAVGGTLVKRVYSIVKSYVKWEAVDYAAKQAGVDVQAFFDKIKELLEEAGQRASSAYDQLVKMEAENATFFNDCGYTFASDLP